MKKTFTFAAVTFAVSATLAGAAHAAEDGVFNDSDAGTTGSTGQSDITLIKNNAVQITNVDDLDLGTATSLAAGETLTQSDDVCVHSTTGGYTVTLDSVDNPGTFVLTNDDVAVANTIAYTVVWTEELATGGGLLGLDPQSNPFPAQPGVEIGSAGAALAADDTDPACGGATNATFSVTVDDTAFNGAPSGTYTDTLSMVVRSL